MGCHRLLQSMKVKSESEVAQSCPTLSDPMDYVAHQASPSMGFARQEYWSGVPSPSPETIPSIYLNICLKCVSCYFTSRPNVRNAWISTWSSCAHPLTLRAQQSNVPTRLPHGDGNPTRSTGYLVPPGNKRIPGKGKHGHEHRIPLKTSELRCSRRQTPPAALNLDAQQNFLRRLY